MKTLSLRHCLVAAAALAACLFVLLPARPLSAQPPAEGEADVAEPFEADFDFGFDNDFTTDETADDMADEPFGASDDAGDQFGTFENSDEGFGELDDSDDAATDDMWDMQSNDMPEGIPGGLFDMFNMGSGEMKTLATIAVASYDGLLEDVDYLGSLADFPAAKTLIQWYVAMYTGGQGLAGVDTTKPLGVILRTDGFMFDPIVCLPVDDIDAMFGIAEGMGGTITDDEQGVKRITLPFGLVIFVKELNGWALAAETPETILELPEESTASLAGMIEGYDIAARLEVENIPGFYRDIARQAFAMGFNQTLPPGFEGNMIVEDMEVGLEEEGAEIGEEALDAETRQQLLQASSDGFFNNLDKYQAIEVGIHVDPQQELAFADLTYYVAPDGELADQFGQPIATETNFAGFYQPNAALTVTYLQQADTESSDQLAVEGFQNSMEELRQDVMAAIDADTDVPDDIARNVLKAAANDFLDALEATADTGRLDAGMSLHLDPNSGAITFIAGAHVADPQKLEAGLQKLESVTDLGPEFRGVGWNAADHNGIAFHTMHLTVPKELEQIRMLAGEELDVVIGIGESAVYAAAGTGHLDALVEAIDASQSATSKTVPPYEFSVSVGQLAAKAVHYVDEEDREMMQQIADILGNDTQGRDHARVILQTVPGGMRYRVELEEGALRGIGMLGTSTLELEEGM